MAYDFPASPTNGQTFTPPGGATYTWDGTTWVISSDPDSIASVAVDMSWRFRPAGTPANYPNRTVLNDKADGTGNDVLFIDELGRINTQSTNYSFNGFLGGGGWRPVKTGYLGIFSFNDVDGSFAIFNTTASYAAGAAATIQPALVINKTGTVTCVHEFHCPVAFVADTVNAVLAATGAGTVYLRPNGAGNPAGQVAIDTVGNLGAAGNVTCVIVAANGRQDRRGSAGGAGQDHNFFWTGTGHEVWVGSVLVGTNALVSDYRIKKDVADLASAWDTVKAFRTVSYTQAEFTPPMSDQTKSVLVKRAVEEYALSHGVPVEEVDEKEAWTPPPPTFTEDNETKWGFIAHELQAVLPSAVSGTKDMEDGVQGLVLAPVVAALTKALQEAMARIEALEAGV